MLWIFIFYFIYNTEVGMSTDNSIYESVRLPLSLIPLHYNLEITPHIYGSKEDFSFDGFVRIKVLCKEKRDIIWLHSKSLKHKEIRITDGEDRIIPVISWDLEAKREFLIIMMGESLSPGETYYIEIKYHGLILNDLKGFFYSSYKDGAVEKYIFSTQMQPTDARKVLPCFDEPALKATFNVTIVRRTDLTSLSNMPILRSEERDHELVADVFETTPIMSTYLLAFALGDIDYLQNFTETNIQIRTWSRSNAVEQTKFALELGCKTMTFFEDYFQIKYILPKEDMIAVPEHIFNAMENWGLITYSENGMLYQEGVTSEVSKNFAAILIAHEISHQWFGNLVTPEWWDDLWLNEGFATYMMFLGVDAVIPEWKMMDMFIIHNRGLQSALAFDDSLTTHPVYVPVNDPAEINEIFDLISYAKGAAVLRMMNFFLGETTFRNGITNYLTSQSYKAATHNELWYAMANQSLVEGKAEIDVKKIMDTWILQKNYPVVTVTLVNGNTIKVEQARFLINEEHRKNAEPIYWEIPFAYTTSDNPNFEKTDVDIHWLHADRYPIYIKDDSLTNSTWLVGNPQQIGYYRVNYEEKMWISIIDQLKRNHKVIHVVNRAQIINDAWNLASSGLVSMDVALGTLEYLTKETDLVPWVAGLQELHKLGLALQLTPAFGHLQIFMQNLLANVFKKVMTGSTHHDKIMKSMISNAACSSGLQSCLHLARQMFDRWLDDSSLLRVEIDNDFKLSVYCAGISENGVRTWDIVYGRYKKSDSASERRSLLHGLSCTREPWIISRFLQLTKNSSEIQQTESIDALIYIAQNPVGRLMVWDFLAENWKHFFDTFGAGLNHMPNLVKGVTEAFNTYGELIKLQHFGERHADLGTATRAYNNAAATIQLNIRWLKKYYVIVEGWLMKQNGAL
ncbi:hypothetical protein ACJMK2_025367 [Sinanodonta woodiana]|uniref:Aminopeptidase n=1 Tax=Sinanodonta woodiana TaxID=1069815 RepID=A0ABD3XK30_SINWO